MTDLAFEWDIIAPKRSFWRGTAIRAIILVPLTIASVYGLRRFAYSQPYIKSSELFVFLLVCALGVVELINGLIHIISNSLPPKLIHFQVNQIGIYRNKQYFPLSIFKTNDVETVLKQTAMPIQEWRQPRPADGKNLILALVSIQGKKVLEFPDEYTRQQFIQTLTNHLYPDSQTG